MRIIRCEDCGFTSDNWRLFVRPLDGRRDWRDKRICRASWKCYRRKRLNREAQQTHE